MSNTIQLTASVRSKVGTAESRRLRRAGQIPANIYGHNEQPISITVPDSEFAAVVSSGAQVVDVTIDGDLAKAMVRDVQWDTFVTQVLHFDLVRVDADETVTVEIQVEHRGVSVGVVGGGNLETHLRTVLVECLAVQIPDSIVARINNVDIGQSLQVKDLDLPEGVRVQNDPEAVVLSVVAPVDQDDEDADELAAPAEPELIGRKAEDEE